MPTLLTVAKRHSAEYEIGGASGENIMTVRDDPHVRG